MKPGNWFQRGSVVLCVVGVGTVIVPTFLGKDGRLDGGRVAMAKLPAELFAFAILSSPLIVAAALGFWWRRDARLAPAGLIAVAACVGLTAWGNISAYLDWSRLPPPTDQITYLAPSLALIASWAVCLAYAAVGLGIRLWLRWRASRSAGSVSSGTARNGLPG